MLLGLANVTDEERLVPVELLHEAGLPDPRDVLDPGEVRVDSRDVVLPQLAPAWLI